MELDAIEHVERKGDAAVDDDHRPPARKVRREEGDGVRDPLVSVDDVHRAVVEDPRQPEGARKIELMLERQRDEVEPLAPRLLGDLSRRPRNDRHPVPPPREPPRELEHLHDAPRREQSLLQDLEDRQRVRRLHPGDRVIRVIGLDFCRFALMSRSALLATPIYPFGDRSGLRHRYRSGEPCRFSPFGRVSRSSGPTALAYYALC